MINTAIIFAMFSYACTMSLSPGPVNMIILSTGINYGFRKSFAFLSGATIGFTCLLVCIGLGLNKLMETYTWFFNVLTLLGCGFIMYMGVKLFFSKGDIDTQTDSNIPTFSQGFALQWLNPKAWIAGFSGVVSFSHETDKSQFYFFIVIYFFTCYVCTSLWAITGQHAFKLLHSHKNVKIFNKIMGTVLVLIAVYLCYQQLFTN